MKKYLPYFLSLAVLAVIGFGFVAYGYVGGSPKTVIENVENYNEAQELVGDQSFGGDVHLTQEDFPYGLKVDGNEVINTSGEFVGQQGEMVYGEFLLDFRTTTNRATTSVAELVDFSDCDTTGVQPCILVYDAYFVPTGVPTTTAWGFRIGTTSVSYIINNVATSNCGQDGTCAAATAHDASILNTGSLTAPATSTIFAKLDYQGTDTRDGSGTRFGVPVKYNEYVIAYASSSAAELHQVIGEGNLFNGYAVVRYMKPQ